MEGENTTVETTETSGSPQTTPAQENNGTGAATEGQQGFSQEYVDNAVKDAVASAREEWQKEADEAAELAKLSKDDKDKKLFEKDKAKLAEDKAKFEHDKLVLETKNQLSEKKLPSSFADFLVSENADSTLKNINSFEAAWNQAVQEAVNEKLKGSTPQTGTTNTGETDPFLAGFMNKR